MDHLNLSMCTWKCRCGSCLLLCTELTLDTSDKINWENVIMPFFKIKLFFLLEQAPRVWCVVKLNKKNSILSELFVATCSHTHTHTHMHKERGRERRECVNVWSIIVLSFSGTLCSPFVICPHISPSPCTLGSPFPQRKMWLCLKVRSSLVELRSSLLNVIWTSQNKESELHVALYSIITL